MALTDHYFRKDYESLRDDVVADFYLPGLSEAIIYKRAVGYFTSRALELVFQGIESLLLKGGKIQLITSPHLDPADIADIEDGYQLRSLMEKNFDSMISQILENDGEDRLGLLGLLIASGQLEIKVAFTTRGDYLFHSKYGVLEDSDGNRIAFNGSNNETENALRKNLESFEVYCSWIKEDHERVNLHESRFNDLWNDVHDYCEVITFPDVNKDRLVALGKQWREKCEKLPSLVDGKLKKWILEKNLEFSVPLGLQVRDYQEEAIARWWQASCQGIFTMATGTGKTKTALVAASRVFEKLALASPSKGLFIAVVVPYESLVRQWAEDIAEFGVTAIQIRGSAKSWTGTLGSQIHELNIGMRSISIVVATNQSFSGKKFQAFINSLSIPFLLIADEVHNFGARSYLRSLPEKASLRLGLSATPEREFDEEGTAGFMEYFGNEVFEYSMDLAIQNGYLTKYRYFPRVVELSDSEAEKYLELTTKINKLFAQEKKSKLKLEDVLDNSSLKKLLIDRSRLIAHVSAKIEAFKKDIESQKNKYHQLVYCAEGSDPFSGDTVAQVDLVQEVLSDEFGMKVAQYTSNTPTQTRAHLLNDFTNGDRIQALISMRCLDEGVDIPNATIGYILASATSYRQAIQRRGRLLRLAEGKREAHIYDYIVIPSRALHSRKIGRQLLRNEIKRAEEFRRLAINSHEAASIINPLKIEYGLLEI